MTKEKKTQYAILGILSIKPMSGYEIRKTMAESTQYFWSESNGQLYPTLAKLAEDKYIKSKDLYENNKHKIIYSLTATGKKKLCSWLLKDVDYYPNRYEILLKIFFGANVESVVSINHIQQHLHHCEVQLKIFKNIADRIKELVLKHQRPIYFLLTVNSGIKIMQAEIDWCHESIKLITEHLTT